jgi:hypothetical protein
MGLKIKWNDDRVRAATTAVLLIARDRLRRGLTDDLIRTSLTDYRNDPTAYKDNKSLWTNVDDLAPLANTPYTDYYGRLLVGVARISEKIVRGKRQFNSLSELDNFLVATLGRVV